MGRMVMYLRILAPLDGSSLGEQALPYVRLLGQSLSVPIDLLRVVDPSFSYMADFAHGTHPERSDSRMVSNAQDYLDGVAATLRAEGLTASGIVSTVYGESPASEIVSQAEQEPATLIAMSTHGRSGLVRWALGSVTDKVLRATSNPLLIVRARNQEGSPTEPNIKSILVPLDGSSLSEQVLAYVKPLAEALELNVILVRVIPSTLEYCGYMEYPAAEYDNFSISLHADAMDYLQRLANELRQQGVPKVEERLLSGDPASSIVDLIEKNPDRLVAMTTHGRSGLGRMMLGSVADRVVRHSIAPVLVIRPEDGSE